MTRQRGAPPKRVTVTACVTTDRPARVLGSGMPTCPCSICPTTSHLPARGKQSGGGCQRWWREWSCSGGAPSTRDRLRSLPSETAVKVLPHRDEDQLGKPLRALSCNSLEWRCDHARWTGARTLLEVSASDGGSGHRRGT